MRIKLIGGPHDGQQVDAPVDLRSDGPVRYQIIRPVIREYEMPDGWRGGEVISTERGFYQGLRSNVWWLHERAYWTGWEGDVRLPSVIYTAMPHEMYSPDMALAALRDYAAEHGLKVDESSVWNDRMYSLDRMRIQAFAYRADG